MPARGAAWHPLRAGHREQRREAERRRMGHRRLVDHVPEERRGAEEQHDGRARHGRREALAQVPEQRPESECPHRIRRQQHRANVGQAQPLRGGIHVPAPGADGAAERIHHGDYQIGRRPDQRGADRHHVIGARRLTEMHELAGDVEVAVDDHAAQLRKVGHAVGGDAVRRGHQLTHAVEQHQPEHVSIGGGAHHVAPRQRAPARMAPRGHEQQRQSSRHDDPGRGPRRKCDEQPQPEDDAGGEHGFR